MFVVSAREDSPISDYVRWNAMNKLRTAAMRAKLFWIILYKTNGLLSYFGQKTDYWKSHEGVTERKIFTNPINLTVVLKPP